MATPKQDRTPVKGAATPNGEVKSMNLSQDMDDLMQKESSQPPQAMTLHQRQLDQLAKKCELPPAAQEKKCCYKHCLILAQMQLDKLLVNQERDQRQYRELCRELDSKLAATSGEKKRPDQPARKEKYLVKPETTPVFKAKRSKIDDPQNEDFLNELIRPCLCDQTWHRSCIREWVVKLELTACPKCGFEYSVGYTDCSATFSTKRRNYLRYMLWQEVLLFGSLWISLAFGTTWVNYYWSINNPHVNPLFWWIQQTLCWQTVFLSLVVFGMRLKAKYSHREIEDIAIYDRSFKQDLDFDSPAILQVYFQELREYEDCPYYYKKQVKSANRAYNVQTDYFRPDSRPLQQLRVLLS